MHKPFNSITEPQSAEYQRLKKIFVRQTILRFMVLPGFSWMFCFAFTAHLFSKNFAWNSVLVYCFFVATSFTMIIFGGKLHAERQLRVFLDNRWELTEELISPLVKRVFNSPLDPITSFDLCANTMSSIRLSQLLGADKNLHFSHDPFKGTIKLARYRPAFLGLTLIVEVKQQKDLLTFIEVRSAPGFFRATIQNGDAFQWVTKLSDELQQVLREKRDAFDMKKRVENLERAALESKLAAMQAQVEPHFLFNTLANLKYLIRTDTDNAVELLTHMIAYLRAALPDMRSISSTVGREVKFAEHFLRIMQIRMGQRLQFYIEGVDEYSDVSMPPAMLISMVENAIKHGLEKATRAGIIWIRVSREKQQIVLSVVDDGVGLNELSGQGVGLANIHQRLALLYGEAASLVVMPNVPRGVDARIYLPLSITPQNLHSTHQEDSV